MSDKYNQKWVLAIAKEGSPRWALTLGQTTYYSCSEAEVTPKWRKHEECHKQQYKRMGFFKFLEAYYRQTKEYGYWDAPLEVEARAAELL